MPTGYTANLEKDYNVKRWLKESVVRAFGICMSLRDEGNLDEKGIMAALMQNFKAEPYHITQLKKYTDELVIANARSDKEWQKIFDKTLEEEQVDYIKRKEEFARKKTAHAESIGKVSALYNKAVKANEDELIVNALKFGLDQLNQAYDFDYTHTPYRPSILDQDVETFKETKLKAIRQNITYHTENNEKETVRGNDSAAVYQKFVDFVNKN